MAYKKEELKQTSAPGKLVYRMTLKDGKSYELTAKDMPGMVDAGMQKCQQLGVKFGGEHVVEWERI